ncbi:threonine/serine dehydratase [Cohaesibacter gelatinilyticus]|uniref:L-threonine ammonia-lyase n=1 Tax=Cohaesibacter gelatinilyticus TaxID=372072 RepID=A0A285PBP8_9HYPH|nr:threonine/serine dehydratase [Cohaesibacter gelatinilyticus]SNZ19154.1 L-threonine ammonia-lyase [Cohaesibacter gelatinilyticus]
MTNPVAPSPHVIDLADVQKANGILRSLVTHTPLLENKILNERLGGRLLVKAECLQQTGAFKIRGAYWRIYNMSVEERKRGVISYSSGNHALGVARAAKLLGSHALIVMPEDAPCAKMQAVRDLGAEIVTYNRDRDHYDEVVAHLEQQTGRLHVPPSAHPQVLAGSGTVALELFEQVKERGVQLDAILTPCGGGGLAASTAIVAKALSPDSDVYAVEPELFDDTRRSLGAGVRLANPKGRRTICDAIMTPMPNAVTFPINLDLLSGGLVVSDDEVRAAMRFAFEHYKIITEPGAAVGIAAVLSGRIDIKDKMIATVVTGGNIDVERFLGLVAV